MPARRSTPPSTLPLPLMGLSFVRADPLVDFIGARARHLSAIRPTVQLK
jgi:hypothetical protein